jgi:WD40 repeat-containing protein SMU1
MTLQIEAADVIKLVLQFCKENALYNTFNILQEETQISLNAVDNMEGFIFDITNGNWDSVLQALATVKLPIDKLLDLYEHIVLELIELKENDAAKAMLRQTKPMQRLKQEQPERYLKLERMLARSAFDSKEGYPGGMTKEKRRAAIAKSLSTELSVVPPARLMSLITQALKWQQHTGQLPPGTAFDLFRGIAPPRTQEKETYPTQVDKIIKFGSKSHPLCAAFSPDGQFLVTGSEDGFVEVWNFITGKLNKDLPYQAKDEFMMHDTSVLCLNFSPDSEHLVTGTQDGKIKVWQILTGKCVRRFESAHSEGVTSASFTKDGSQILSTSHDQTVRIHGLKSGKTLKIFRGHTSFVNSASFIGDGTKIVSVSSDGNIKIWDAKTTDCLHTFSPVPNTEIQVKSITQVIVIPKNPDNMIVMNRSLTIYQMDIKGKIVSKYTNDKALGQEGTFVCCCLSPKGDYLYAVSEDFTLYCYEVATAQLAHFMKVHDKHVNGLTHHPHLNLLGTYSDDGSLKCWKP